MLGKYSGYKNKLRVIIFIMLLGLAWKSCSFAQNELLNPKKKPLKKSEASAKEKETFKRFEISYGGMYFSGKLQEEGSFWDTLGLGVTGKLNYKNKVSNRLHIRTGISKLAFYFTPKTYVEGAYGATYLNKKGVGSTGLTIDVNGKPYLSENIPDHVMGKDIRFWSADFLQNIYTHKKTGITLDALTGYASYIMRVDFFPDVEDAGSVDFLGAKRTFSGMHFGTRLKIPFTLANLKEHPFIYKTDVVYTPNELMKGKDMYLLHPYLIPDYFTSAGKGSALEIHTGLTCKVNSSLSIEVGYNYYQFKVDKGSYYGVEFFYGGEIGYAPLDVKIQNAKIVVHGPSLCAKIAF